MSAILFLYGNVLLKEIEFPTDVFRAKKPNRLPTVISKTEALTVTQRMNGIPKLMTQLLFGSGLRLMESLRLRVKDIDFATHLLQNGYDIRTIQELLGHKACPEPVEGMSKPP